ncbi:MAG TPA: protein-disulfide reductase DsbD [Cellvibrionaceae bacterium]
MMQFHRSSWSFLSLLLLLVCQISSAANDLTAERTFSTNANPLTSYSEEPPEFLPVTEAYPFQAFIDNEELVLHWDIEPGYYLYQERFRFEPRPAVVLDADYPPGQDIYDEYFEKDMVVYYSGVTLRFALPSDTAPFQLRVESQGCAEAGLCYPPHSEYLLIDPAQGTVDAITFEAFEGEPSNVEAPPEGADWVIKILLFALAGGVILNLMPCVFPVLSIKVMSLAQADRNRLPYHGWAYTAGIIACFGGFALVLLAARAGGEAIGWGFQLQSPLVISALVYLFLLMGLSLSGVINFGTRLMGVGQNLTQKGGLTGSFFTGVLAAVVASPCTAPFMGVALGYALTQPAASALIVFIALGLGMALPLLLLCYAPGLIRHLPAPGPWMDTLKQVLAFPLYLTALWLLWVLGRQAGSDSIIVLLGGVISFGFALWLLHSGRQPLRWVLAVLAIIAALFAPFAVERPEHSERWQPYSAERLKQLRQEGRGVFVNLTADWCITCLANERITLNTDTIEAAFDQYNIATLKGDWTRRDPRITQLLDEYGRSGVPLYLWYAPGSTGKALILPQLLRKEHLLEAFAVGGEQ